MIRFYREDNSVKCEVDLDVPQYERRTFYFYWGCNSPVFAGLLAAAFTTAMQDALEKIRRQAYEEGARDAKAKTRKRKFFRLGCHTKRD